MRTRNEGELDDAQHRVALTCARGPRRGSTSCWNGSAARQKFPNGAIVLHRRSAVHAHDGCAGKRYSGASGRLRNCFVYDVANEHLRAWDRRAERLISNELRCSEYGLGNYWGHRVNLHKSEPCSWRLFFDSQYDTVGEP